MCGIVGILGADLDAQSAAALIARMTSQVAHRGPDDAGIYVGNGIALGHRRLSIVGLGDGHQPMLSDDGEVAISFNGEIFNYVELRDELKQRGHVFKTGSDTEVILRLYDTYGIDALERLNGDFAIAIWDGRKRRLMLARDRMGVRPLFYAWHKGALHFASEVKSLLEVPGIEAHVDPIALDQIFTLWAPIAPRTAFAGISELLPGEVMTIVDGHAERRRYWSMDFPDLADARADTRSEALIAEELLDLLDDATRIRMRADVTVGSYLSGGLDSSLLTSLAARHTMQGIRTFSVTFDGAEHDESHYQRIMADMLGTIHNSVAVSDATIAARFPDVIRATERPILRTAPAPLHELSALVARNGIKVVLTGEGADEVFAGYDIFREASVRRFAGRQPGSRIRSHLFRRLYPYLPGLQAQSADYLAAFFEAGGDASDPLYSHRPRFRSTAAGKAFFSAALRDTLLGYDATAELAASLPERFSRWHPLHQAQYLEATQLLPGYILSSQGDRVAMAHAVEGRFPFLDHRVVEFASRIPPGLKLRGLSEKHILKRVARGLVDQRIIDRSKQPYRAPESQAFAMADYASQMLSPKLVAANGLFNPQMVSRLDEKRLTRGLSGFRDNAVFVGVLSTQLFIHQFVAAGARTRTPRAA